MELSVRLDQQFVQAKNDLQNVKSENQKLQKQNAMLNEQLKIVQEQLDVMRWEGLMMEMNYETSAFRMENLSSDRTPLQTVNSTLNEKEIDTNILDVTRTIISKRKNDDETSSQSSTIHTKHRKVIDIQPESYNEYNQFSSWELNF